MTGPEDAKGKCKLQSYGRSPFPFLPKESAKDCRIRLSRFASSIKEISLLISYSTTEITIKDTEVEADSPSHPLRPRLLYEAACAARSDVFRLILTSGSDLPSQRSEQARLELWGSDHGRVAPML